MSRALQATTGDVVVVATVPTFEPYGGIREYAVKMFENRGRGIGDKGKDNGVLILLAMKERRVRVEVGYGLEQWITDGFAGRNQPPGDGAGVSARPLRQRPAAGHRANRRPHRAGSRRQSGRRPRSARPRDSATTRRFRSGCSSWVHRAADRQPDWRRRGGGADSGAALGGWSSGVGPFGGGWGGGGFGGRGGGFGGGFGGFGGGSSGGGGGGVQLVDIRKIVGNRDLREDRQRWTLMKMTRRTAVQIACWSCLRRCR